MRESASDVVVASYGCHKAYDSATNIKCFGIGDSCGKVLALLSHGKVDGRRNCELGGLQIFTLLIKMA